MSNKLTISNERSLESVSFPFYRDVCARIDPLLKAACSEAETASNEALNSNIFGRAFVAVADTFVGLLNTLKTNAFKFRNKLKRSELREFVESNRLKTSTVYRLPYDKVKDVMLDFPSNMQTTFKVAIDSVNEIYKHLNGLNHAQVAYMEFNEIYKAIASEDPTAGAQVVKIGQILSQIVKATKPAVLECQKNFMGNAVGKKAFSELYLDVNEFKKVTDTLLEIDYRLQDAHKILELVGKIESTLKSICDVVGGSNVSFDSKSIMMLGETAKGLALLFDSYGLAATRQLALEHNHVINLNTIFSKVR